MKTRANLLVIIFIVCVNIIGLNSQNISQQFTIQKISERQVINPYFRTLAKYYYSKTSLPYFQDIRTLDMRYMMKHKPYTSCSYKGADRDSSLPLYADLNKKNKNTREDAASINALFYETSGEYVIGIISLLSDDHNVLKYLVVTFDMHGKAIDHLVFSERYSSVNGYVFVNQGNISQQLLVNTYSLEFENDYIVSSNGELVQNLIGQRVDRKYIITPKGKFKLITETKYQPKKYTKEDLKCTKNIYDGNEIRL